MFTEPIPFVEYAPLQTYIVTCQVLKPKRTRTEQHVKANSASDARNVIYGQYGKENVQIVGVHKEEK
jgi:hypothetical protein